MQRAVIDRDGYRYKWVVRGEDEIGCVKDIEENDRTELTDYLSAFFAEQYGCFADVERVRVMSHNQYQAYLQNNARRLDEGAGYTVDDFRRDAKAVEVLPFHLERFHLDPGVEAIINKRFDSISYTGSGDACFRCHMGSNMGVDFLADDLGCEGVCNQGYNGFYKNDRDRFILEFSDGSVSLLLCTSQERYAAQLAEFYQLYDIEGCDVCLEIYFDDVHMDNMFLPRENVQMAISALLQKGYDGYDETVKTCWETFMAQKAQPQLRFRVVETPVLARDFEFSPPSRGDEKVADMIAAAEQESECSHGRWAASGEPVFGNR